MFVHSCENDDNRISLTFSTYPKIIADIEECIYNIVTKTNVENCYRTKTWTFVVSNYIEMCTRYVPLKVAFVSTVTLHFTYNLLVLAKYRYFYNQKNNLFTLNVILTLDNTANCHFYQLGKRYMLWDDHALCVWNTPLELCMFVCLFIRSVRRC